MLHNRYIEKKQETILHIFKIAVNKESGDFGEVGKVEKDKI